MTRTATAETRLKMSEAKLGANHPQYGKAHDDEMRAKISKTLSKKGAAERADKSGLPLYVRKIEHADRVGYQVWNHPTLKPVAKTTSRKKLTDAVLKEKLDACLVYLATATTV